MRIVILVSGLPPHYLGGTETQTYNMAGHLARSGHKVLVVTRSVPGTPSEEKRNGFTIRRFRYINIPVLRFISHFISSLRVLKGLRDETDVLQCMMVRPNGFVGAWARHLFGYRYLTWLRSEYRFFEKGKRLSAWMGRVALRNSDVILTQTERIREEVLADYPDKKVIAVNNGIDIPKMRAAGNKIIFVGTLNDRKGCSDLITALRMLHDAGMHLPETTVIGDGPERKSLERMAAGLPVSFVGRKVPAELMEYLLDGMFLVFPSKEGKGEGMPNAVLEGMSMGLPVIATRVAGVPDMITHGRTGFLVNPERPDEIAECMKRLIEDTGLRKRMSSNCLKDIRKFEWKNVISRLEREVYPLFAKHG